MTNRTYKKMKAYTRSIERRLNMPQDVKARVMTDFISSIQGRREAGQTDEEIFAELGSPKKVAAELNEQMKEYTYIKSPWRWVCLVLIILCSASLVCGGFFGLLAYLFTLSTAESVGIIGSADGPTTVFVTTSPDYFLYQTGITLILLAMGILGFYRLSRCPRK
ncbi:MAG: hypothetical protein IJX69_04130 [Oscillospiraceae bacterium]|nr:hypothetical protein [Oscillospiraceae bacterium]